jgi:tetratricopeptide (TPR) repeat protein
VAGPIVFLLLLEVGLRAARFGYPVTFFVPSERDGAVTTNRYFGWHYQQRGFTEPRPRLVSRRKPDNTARIFVLGGSAAMGTPDPSFGFARILEFMLRRSFPDRRFEVINAAMRGINSHVVRLISSECAALEPDVFVVYLGNNEVAGLYGPKTPTGFLGAHPSLIPAHECIKRSRTNQLLRLVMGDQPSSGRNEKRTQTAAHYARYRTTHDDPRRDAVYRNFGRNLRQICRHGLASGASVLLSTVAVNLRDCPPLASLHRPDLAAPQLREWQRLYNSGSAAQGKEQFAQAVAHFRDATAIDDHFAELHFRLGRALHETGGTDAAQRHFVLARDWDALQFRTDSRLNDIVREVAAEHENGRVCLVDAEKALAASERCPDAICGDEFFYEHVHFRFEGDYEMAKALMPAVARVLSTARADASAQTAEIPTRDECAQALAFTAWDEVNTAAAMARLTASPPFTEQLGHATRQRRKGEAIASVMENVDEAFIAEVIQKYHSAIAANPDDWPLRYNLGAFLHQLKRFDAAAEQFAHVVRALPHVSEYRTLLASALSRAGRRPQAVRQLREVLTRDPRYTPARDALDQAVAR